MCHSDDKANLVFSVVIRSDMWQMLNDSQRRSWGIDPNALIRPRKTTFRSLLPFLVAFIMLVCSKTPENPGIPVFFTDVSMYLFLFR